MAALESARELPATHPYVARLHAWKALADAREFGRLFDRLIGDSGIVRREIFFGRGERRLTNYLHVLELLLLRARSTHGTLRDLLAELSGLLAGTRAPLGLDGNVQRLDSDRRAVQIMTVHKAKGLEAAVVFVAGGMRAARVSGEEARVLHRDGRRVAWLGKTTPSVDAILKVEEREEEKRLMYVALTRAQGRLYLPLIQGAPSNGLRGAYRHVNRRLVALASQGAPWLVVEDVRALHSVPHIGPPAGEGLTEPPTELLHAVDRRATYAALREAHAGAISLSYTRLRGRRAPEPPSTSKRAIHERPEDDLTAARSTGIFLHEVLERIPLASFGAGIGFEAWRQRPDVAIVVAEAMAVHRIDPPQRAHAERLVWAAYRTPLLLPGGESIEGIASAEPIVREMDFAYPLVGGGRAEGESPRGYVRGAIDLAFTVRGATYFVDWKSDSLVSYAQEALARHVDAHYGDQVRLYALAVSKLLGVSTADEHDARFGGVLYCFLRGLGQGNRGVWTARPSWDDLGAWERGLGT